MIPERYVWLVWSLAFMVPWALLFWRFPAHRRAMKWASLFTTPFGLTEPLFVPSYWSPPSLFDLASRTGFDIESLVFSFAIGGVGAVLYNVLTRRELMPVRGMERHHRRHRLHRWAVGAPFAVFPLLYLLPWNAIYPAIVAMLAGAGAAMLCRPDLARKTVVGSALFLALYAVFLTGLEVTAPDYIARVWNLPALSGVMIWKFPLEELLFALAFGAYWTGVYEHVSWTRTTAP